ncbi:MAG: N-acetylmuramoyl-L-alanine amidase [Candidatus Cellulosilyticum pullistercoris]|uniref:N-acetylmuramoyl-L-alanine amidase n=1 Tax=Candidatus Cellulosilyticum pullistercoris TaxID=2838521 RepID=A0A9E2KBZ9_9FIRM|nr:N-acetylmuramoyl-L-alanine amidase [Candidatus Cellulosilyticum pullistercoris]
MKVIKKCVSFLVMVSLLMAVSGFLFKIKQKPIVAEEVEAAIGVNYTIDHIPLSNKRPGIKRSIKYIVIHNTANEESTARNERDYLTNPNNTSSTSFNIVVDDKEIIEAIPANEMAFHAGDREGNQKGIGIELCESGDFEKTKANAAKLVAYLMKTYDISLSEVRTHHDFSGKDCPRKMLGNWEDFLEAVKIAYQTLD